MLNCYHSETTGLHKRQPTEYVNRLYASQLGNAHHHVIDRDEENRFKVVFRSGQVDVFDLEGNPQTVTYPNGTSYLSTNTPNYDIEAITVKDFTFVVNKTVVVEMDGNSASDAPPPYKGMVYIKQPRANTTYEVKINGAVVASFTTSAPTPQDAQEIAQNLAGQISGYGATAVGPIITLSNGSDFTLEIEDGFGNNAAYGIKDTIQIFEELPNEGPMDCVVKVAGEPGTDEDDYYVVYDGQAWVETVGPGVLQSLNAATMPHVLVPTGSGTWEFKQAEWDDRISGDDVTNPLPSFVGQTINDVFIYRSRLGLLSGENVVLSETDQFFNYFRRSVVNLYDTAPIDSHVTTNRVSTLYYAEPLDNNVPLFGAYNQFELTGQLLASEPGSIDSHPTTELDINLKCRPLSAGHSVYFTVNRDEHTGVYIRRRRNATSGEFAEEVTENIPSYIGKDAYHMAACPNENRMALLTETNPSSIFIYDWYDKSEQRLISSWHQWTYSGEVLDVFYINTRMYVTIQHVDGVYLYYSDQGPDRKDTGADYITHLDRRVDRSQASVSYNSVSGTTRIDFPFSLDTTLSYSVVQKDGIEHPVQTVTGNSVYVFGDLQGADFWAGEDYTMQVVLSKFELNSPDVDSGGLSVARRSRNMTVQAVSLYHEKTAFYHVLVNPHHSTLNSEYTFTSTRLGSYGATVGRVPLEEGDHTFLVAANAERVTIKIENHTWKPTRLISLEWRGYSQNLDPS